ncbi:mechanosensitive ion channel family protein [Pseudoalteromonas sp. MMG012]|uniref:mechanosensitive ion channel family protein n=1 Tax=Pseudoalteromonas sp. MMG012 TaxID=2822686 RepID=UPI001B39CDCE|nr:mechanosensitive ion channel domain-containing protein [Pseudoalteromonas sp. MMG012]MBQ4850676.1 mechanosensitive ion channel [Pseudoalteromonas sp. MMG012]
MSIAHITDLIEPWLNGLPKEALLSAISANSIGFIGVIFVYIFTRRLVFPTIQNTLTKFSPSRLGQLTEHLNKLTGRMAAMLSCVAFLAFYPRVLVAPEWVLLSFKSVGQIVLIVISGFLLSSLVNLAHGIYSQLRFAKDVPIQGIVQVTKLMTFIVCSILIISLLLDKSPTYILSGFGAIAAVTLLVFKDTILGLVASIQIAANRLVTIGDWIQVDAFGADGEVIDLGLNTVRVRNWDNTVTTIPTYMLITDSFKNWRAMQESAGRRIKRALLLDMHSVVTLNAASVTQLQNVFPELLDVGELPQPITNVGLFRRYAEAYLRKHKDINQDCVLMVRELAPQHHGLPIEFYCFSVNKQWVFYEHLQADIMDHMIATMSEFELRPYQTVSGQLQINSRQEQTQRSEGD